MKPIVVKINKKYRNGQKEHFLVLYEGEIKYTNDIINDSVEEWCEDDPSGRTSGGYSYLWVIVTDFDIIEKVLNNELNNIKSKTIIDNEKIVLLEKILKISVPSAEDFARSFKTGKDEETTAEYISDMLIAFTKLQLEQFIKDCDIKVDNNVKNMYINNIK